MHKANITKLIKLNTIIIMINITIINILQSNVINTTRYIMR
jgi:hypothetical protein